jgi:hypothetical protein
VPGRSHAPASCASTPGRWGRCQSQRRRLHGTRRRRARVLGVRPATSASWPECASSARVERSNATQSAHNGSDDAASRRSAKKLTKRGHCETSFTRLRPLAPPAPPPAPLCARLHPPAVPP